MLINRREEKGILVVVELLGQFEFEDKAHFINQTQLNLQQKLVVDLSQLTHLSLEGVQAIADLALVMGMTNPNVVFVAPLAQQVINKLDVTGIATLIRQYESVAAASQALQTS